jgi:hypothetical protein
MARQQRQAGSGEWSPARGPDQTVERTLTFWFSQSFSVFLSTFLPRWPG